MSQPSGQKRIKCPYCGQTYTRTNWMIRWHSGSKDSDGRPLTDTHQIKCYQKSAEQLRVDQEAGE